MKTKQLDSWKELGQRIAEARQAEGISQAELGEPLGLDRSAVSRIESGIRQVDSLELSRIASRLGRPLSWFFTENPALVVSRRDANAAASVVQEDALLDLVTRDVLTLIGLKLLHPSCTTRLQKKFMDLTDAERLAEAARRRVGDLGPIADLSRTCEVLGLLGFSLRSRHGDDGATGKGRYPGVYACVSGVGVAIVDGALQAARRRFALAHELCHHLLKDDSDTYVDVPISRSEREKLVDAFAIHFLMPRKSVSARWSRLLKQEGEERGAAMVLGHEYGVNWSAVLGHLVNLGLMDQQQRSHLVSASPTATELLARGLRTQDDLHAPTVPGTYAAAVVKGYRKHKLTAGRAIEMLYGALERSALPEPDEVPLEAYESDREPL